MNVVDTTAPVIALNGDANISHKAGFVYVDANASWTDLVDGSGMLLRLAKSMQVSPAPMSLLTIIPMRQATKRMQWLRTVHVINLAPHDLVILSDSNLSVYENGRVVLGLQTLTGLDENPDSALTYHLMGVMDVNLTLSQDSNISAENTDVAIEDVFDLDTNGSLTAVRPLDYETRSHSI